MTNNCGNYTNSTEDWSKLKAGVLLLAPEAKLNDAAHCLCDNLTAEQLYSALL